MHQYTESGLNNIYLNNGYQFDNGSLELQDRWNLHYVIANQIIDQKAKLTPDEFKYLRTEIKATQAVIGKALGVCTSTVRNWEHGRSEISPIADRMMRLMYRSCAADKTNLIELVNDLMQCETNNQKIVCSYSNRWKVRSH